MNKEELIRLQKIDPVKKQGEVSETDRGSKYSPLSPPDAMAPPSIVKVNYEDFHPYLKQLVDEHLILKKAMEELQMGLTDLAETKNILGKNNKLVKDFFKTFMSEFILHNQKEENVLFPILAKRFLEIGEHSKTARPITPIDILKNEHLEAMQIGAEARCTWDLLQQVFDPPSQTILLGHFLRKSHTLLEMMKLHIFREDDIVFSLAQKHLSQNQLNQMLE